MMLFIEKSKRSYTMPTRAVWDLLPEPAPRGRRQYGPRGRGITILKPTMATHLHYYSNASRIDVIRPQP